MTNRTWLLGTLLCFGCADRGLLVPTLAPEEDATPSASGAVYVKASDTGEYEEFGSALSISDDTLAVGARGDCGGGLLGDTQAMSARRGGAVYIFVRSGASFAQQALLRGDDTASGDCFGASVSLSGDTLVVGAPHAGAGWRGAAYVFVRQGTTWAQQARVEASDAQAGALFGADVSASGDRFAASALEEGVGPLDSFGSPINRGVGLGTAYVFARRGGGWAEEARLKSARLTSDAYFGRGLALDAETLAIGCEGGPVSIRTRSGGAWSELTSLEKPALGNPVAFGETLSLSGDTLAVGAAWDQSGAIGVNGDPDDRSAPASGAVFVYVRKGSSFVEQAFLKASNTGRSDEFGIAVSLHGDELCVGADQEASRAIGLDGDQADEGAFMRGAAYLFRRDGTSWSQRAYVKPTNFHVQADEFSFGRAVAVSSGMLAVGAIGENSDATGVDGDETDFSVFQAGAVYLYPVR